MKINNTLVLHIDYLFVKIRDNLPAPSKRNGHGWLKISLSAQICLICVGQRAIAQ